MGAFSVGNWISASVHWVLIFRTVLKLTFYVREIIGPGQPVQLRLNTRTATHVWQAGKLKQGLPTTLGR